MTGPLIEAFASLCLVGVGVFLGWAIWGRR